MFLWGVLAPFNLDLGFTAGCSCNLELLLITRTRRWRGGRRVDVDLGLGRSSARGYVAAGVEALARPRLC